MIVDKKNPNSCLSGRLQCQMHDRSVKINISLEDGFKKYDVIPMFDVYNLSVREVTSEKVTATILSQSIIINDVAAYFVHR